MHCFFDEHCYAVVKVAFKDLAPDAFVEGLGAFSSVDVEDRGEDG